MNEKPLLTICIPTYNRYEKLRPMIDNLLSCPRNDFEILLQDNCSTDGTENIKEDIKDERLKVIRNPKNIGGIINGYGALYNASGKYCMICLDKDTILAEKLAEFLDYLIENPCIKYGLCELNVTVSSESIIYASQFDRFDFFAYRCRHPSGMFWDSETFHSTNIIGNVLNSHVVFGFFTELIFAEIAAKVGDGCYYRNTLIVTESPIESAKKKTLTYSKDKIFFFPKNRIIEFKVYLGQLQTLKISKKPKFWLKVFCRGLITTSIGFRNVMKDEAHLQHYGLGTRSVGVFELMFIAFRYCFTVLLTSRKKAFYCLFS